MYRNLFSSFLRHPRRRQRCEKTYWFVVFQQTFILYRNNYLDIVNESGLVSQYNVQCKDAGDGRHQLPANRISCVYAAELDYGRIDLLVLLLRAAAPRTCCVSMFALTTSHKILSHENLFYFYAMENLGIYIFVMLFSLEAISLLLFRMKPTGALSCIATL